MAGYQPGCGPTDASQPAIFSARLWSIRSASKPGGPQATSLGPEGLDRRRRNPSGVAQDYVRDEGGMRILLPGDPGYDEAMAAIPEGSPLPGRPGGPRPVDGD